MRGFIAGKVRTSDSLAEVVEPDDEIAGPVSGPAEIAEVDDGALLPEQSMERLHVQGVQGIESGADSRCAGRLSVVVHDEHGSHVVARDSGQLFDIPVFPNDRAKLEPEGS